jgi:two-component system, NtrC family, response regulator AtoC
MDSARTILLVDDDPTLIAVFEAVLRKGGYTVITAGNAEQALEILRTSSISAIITDLHMPKMNGIVMLGQLAAEGSTIPAILVTGSGKFEDSYAGEPGVSALLIKPIGSRTLLRTLERVLGQKKGGDSAPPK